MCMDARRKKPYDSRKKQEPTRAKMGLRLTLCLALSAAAIAARSWYPQGVSRAAAVVFGAQGTPARQVFSEFTQTMADRGIVEAFASLPEALGDRAAARD